MSSPSERIKELEEALARAQEELEKAPDDWVEIDDAYNAALENRCTCGEGEDGERNCGFCNQWELARSKVKAVLRRAQAAEANAERKGRALRELVRLEDLKDSISTTDGDWDELAKEYRRCKPLAWQAARAALTGEQHE